MTWALCFLFAFSDPCSGLELEIPDSFYPISADLYDDHCWYSFKNLSGGDLTIEIEENEYQKSHYEHFHYALTKGAGEKEQMISEGLEFRSFFVGPLEISRCQLKVLALAEKYCIPLYLCDYLFVHDHHSFTISYTKEDDGASIDSWMSPLLESIHFGECP